MDRNSHPYVRTDGVDSFFGSKVAWHITFAGLGTAPARLLTTSCRAAA